MPRSAEARSGIPTHGRQRGASSGRGYTCSGYGRSCRFANGPGSLLSWMLRNLTLASLTSPCGDPDVPRMVVQMDARAMLLQVSFHNKLNIDVRQLNGCTLLTLSAAGLSHMAWTVLVVVQTRVSKVCRAKVRERLQRISQQLTPVQQPCSNLHRVGPGFCRALQGFVLASLPGGLCNEPRAL